MQKQRKRRNRRRKMNFGAWNRATWLLAGVSFVLFVLWNVWKGAVFASVEIGTIDVGQVISVADKKAVIIRKEQNIVAPQEGYVDYIVPEGQRVRKGTNVAVMRSGYNLDDLQDSLRLIDYKLKEKQNVDVSKDLTMEINKRNLELQTLYADLQKRIFSGEEEYLESLKQEIISLNEQKKFLEDSVQGKNVTVEELKAQKQKLLSQINGNEYYIKAPMTGIVVAYSDGYEDKLTFENRNNLTVSDIGRIKDYDEVDLKKKILAKKSVGRVVYNFKYYFACQVDKEDIDHIISEQPVTIYVENQEITAYLEDFHQGDDGKFLGLFRVEDELFHFYEKRCFNIKVEYQNRKGLKIPKSAVFKGKDGNDGIFVIDEAGVAVFREIRDPVAEDKDYIICKYNSQIPREADDIKLYDSVILNPIIVKEGDKVR